MSTAADSVSLSVKRRDPRLRAASSPSEQRAATSPAAAQQCSGRHGLATVAFLVSALEKNARYSHAYNSANASSARRSSPEANTSRAGPITEEHSLSAMRRSPPGIAQLPPRSIL